MPTKRVLLRKLVSIAINNLKNSFLLKILIPDFTTTTNYNILRNRISRLIIRVCLGFFFNLIYKFINFSKMGQNMKKISENGGNSKQYLTSKWVELHSLVCLGKNLSTTMHTMVINHYSFTITGQYLSKMWQNMEKISENL